MAIWQVEQGYAGDLGKPCYRIFPAGEPERWIAETNPDLPAEVQEECAQFMARALTELLGI